MAHTARQQLVARKCERETYISSSGGIGKRNSLTKAPLRRAASVKKGNLARPRPGFPQVTGSAEPEKSGSDGAGKP